MSSKDEREFKLGHQAPSKSMMSDSTDDQEAKINAVFSKPGLSEIFLSFLDDSTLRSFSIASKESQSIVYKEKLFKLIAPSKETEEALLQKGETHKQAYERHSAIIRNLCLLDDAVLRKRDVDIYTKIVYQRRLQNRIGPDLSKLIRRGETAPAAYERHQAVVASLYSSFIANFEDLTIRINTYPEYFFNMIVSDEVFAALFPHSSVLPFFALSYLAHTPIIMHRIITSPAEILRVNISLDDLLPIVILGEEIATTIFQLYLNNDRAFAHLFVDIHSLIKLNEHFLTLFPKFVEAVIERSLTNDADFRRIVPNFRDLDYLLKHLGSFGSKAKGFAGMRALTRIVTNPADTTRMLGAPEKLQIFLSRYSAHYPTITEKAAQFFSKGISSSSALATQGMFAAPAASQPPSLPKDNKKSVGVSDQGQRRKRKREDQDVGGSSSSSSRDDANSAASAPTR